MTEQPPVRAAADETVDVAFTVNGTPVNLRVPARLTLADALREHLGLTGTHLGCEHGVCGMCTVLVDGEAARACLLFTVQCEGVAVTTVEGLGAPEDQHPLQQSFAHHHALQCGFCTPGFLMSSYDLLTHRAGVGAEELRRDLPGELSGVLCRCTGYRNILTAVADVAAAYPDGVPGPRNCGQHALVGRRATFAPAAPPPEQVGGAGGGGAASAATEVTRPAGKPSQTVQVTSSLTAPVDAVWSVLDDFDLLARCLPGAELTEVLDDDRYRGRAKVSLGPVRLSFDGLAQVIDRDPDAHRMRVLASGADTGGSATQADINLAAEAAGEGTTLRADADLFLSGRIAQFGRALAGDISRRMFEQFAEAVDEAARTGETPTVSRGPNAARWALEAVLSTARRRLHRLPRLVQGLRRKGQRPRS